MELQENQEIESLKMEELQSTTERINLFIDNLSNLNELDKYWARNNALEELENTNDLSKTVKKLEKKYSFYDQAGALRNEICKKAPDGKGNTVCNLIDTSILNVSSEGDNREWKLEELKQIKRSVDSLKNKQDAASLTQRREAVKDSVASKILMLFDTEFAEQFKTFQEQMGAPRFWSFTKAMSPAEFPNFTTTFNFSVPRDFLKKLTQKNLNEWPPKLRKALTNDAEEMLSSEVFEKNRDQKLSKLKSSKTIADFAEQLLELKKIRDIEQLKLERERTIEKRQQELDTKKQENLDIKTKEREEKEELQKEKQDTEQTEFEEKKKQEEEKKGEKQDDNVDLGAEKQTILDFYNKSIEHAEKVSEECSNWGVRPDDIEYWGQEGVKNRMNLLKKRGTWNDYVRFNSNDKYIPSNARGDGFRFRWLNVNTGSRISAAGADSGIKYMQRYKESGYQLCVLAGAFSIDWAGGDSPVHTPVQFLEKMKSLRSELIGKATKK